MDWDQLCLSCGGTKSKRAKKCSDCRKRVIKRPPRKKVSRKRPTRGIPTEVTLADGTVVITRSKLEADWIVALENCEPCYECLKMTILQKGRLGTFTGNYTPDLIIGDVFIELKSTFTAAKKDTRPARSLKMNPEAKFVVIGGYPIPGKTFYVKMLSSEGEKEFKEVTLIQLLNLLGC